MEIMFFFRLPPTSHLFFALAEIMFIYLTQKESFWLSLIHIFNFNEFKEYVARKECKTSLKRSCVFMEHPKIPSVAA